MKGKDYAKNLKLLGKTVNKPSKELECFPNPGCDRVLFETDEVTSLCPKTGQPDFHYVRIEYVPEKLCIESKSLKMYLWSFRQEGAFIEHLSRTMCDQLFTACKPRRMTVTLKMKPRGGISIEAATTRVMK